MAQIETADVAAGTGRNSLEPSTTGPNYPQVYCGNPALSLPVRTPDQGQK